MLGKRFLFPVFKIMANQGAKKRKEENEKHLKMLQKVIGGANVIFILFRLMFRFSSSSWRHWSSLVFTSAIYSTLYDQIRRMAIPSYDESGDLLDGGYDLSMGGLCGYLHDIIYVTAFVQSTSIISDYFWWLYLSIPGFALYKLWVLILYPYFFKAAPPEQEEDEKTRRKREKAERKASRPRLMKGRRQ